MVAIVKCEENCPFLVSNLTTWKTDKAGKKQNKLFKNPFSFESDFDFEGFCCRLTFAISANDSRVILRLSGWKVGAKCGHQDHDDKKARLLEKKRFPL